LSNIRTSIVNALLAAPPARNITVESVAKAVGLKENQGLRIAQAVGGARKILFDSGPYMPLIMVMPLRPKILKTMGVRIRLMIQ
jgi:hypothetical protein